MRLLVAVWDLRLENASFTDSRPPSLPSPPHKLAAGKQSRHSSLMITRVYKSTWPLPSRLVP